MKNLKNHYLRFCNVLLTSLLTLLGFSGCELNSPEEYGTPHATYELKGKVINEKQQSLPNMQVVVGELLNDQFPEYDYYRDTLYTDAKGEFVYKNEYAWPGNLLRAKFTGINKNGDATIYKADSINVDMGELKDGSDWYRGYAYKEETLTVKEKKQENAE